MALSGGHSATVAEDEAAILAGRRRIKDVPPASLEPPASSPQQHSLLRSGARALSGLLARAWRVLPRRARPHLPLLDALPGSRRRRERRQAAQRAADVEQVVLGAPARGWPRDDIPGLYSALSWLASRLAIGSAAAMLASPIGPMAAALAKVSSGFAGGRLGYNFGRRLDRIEVAHVQQYLQDIREAAQAGMQPEACVEYAAMCDAGPFSPEVAPTVGRTWDRHGSGTWRQPLLAAEPRDPC